MSEKIPLLVIAGPTASGKTGLSIDLAKELGGEVVSADSMQIYRYMTIGTAKPTAEEMQGIPHHLMDFLDPGEEFSVAQYVTLAREAILDIHSRGKLPMLVGGTGLYISSLIDHISFAETGSSADIRRRYQKEAQEHGNEYVLELLRRIDPETAAALHSNNLGRIIRALEIYELTGQTMTWHRQQSRLQPSPYALSYIGLNFRDRALLWERINRRVDIMVEQGLLQEAEALFSSGFSGTAKQAIGYKELLPYFEGGALEPCLDAVRMYSRRYAKRQLTWFRRDERIHWFYPDDYPSYDVFYEAVQQDIENSGILCYTNQ